jgi:hypothetical protein
MDLPNPHLNADFICDETFSDWTVSPALANNWLGIDDATRGVWPHRECAGIANPASLIEKLSAKLGLFSYVPAAAASATHSRTHVGSVPGAFVTLQHASERPALELGTHTRSIGTRVH